MRLTILAIGKLRDPWVLAGCAEYEKRLRPRLPVEVIEVKDEEQLCKKLPPRFKIWVLDERGEQPSSRELSQRLQQVFLSGSAGLALCIGGADGHSAELRKRADYLLGLSKLTLPHRLARLIVMEQIYRAQSILDGSPYHRE